MWYVDTSTGGRGEMCRQCSSLSNLQKQSSLLWKRHSLTVSGASYPHLQ